MTEVYVINCCRTAIGAFAGSLKDTSAVQLGAVVVKEAISRSGIDAAMLDEVLMGCVLTSGLGQNVARQVALNAGIGIEVPASTIGMVCGSGMKAVIEGARAIMSGDANIVVAGGTENMSQAPYALPDARFGAKMFDAKMVDTMVYDGLTDAFDGYHMGITAENICEQWGLTREELDAFALSSQQKAAAAIAQGKFIDEIVPLEITQKRQSITFEQDEFPRANTTLEALARLKPAFKKDGGMVTAGNSSGINDGAAAIILASKESVERYGLVPMAKLIAWGQAGVAPEIMGIGPVEATKKALAKAGLSMEDISLIEANEAFAAQSCAVARELAIDPEKLNVNGGAIALGHPIGASGARIIVSLLHELQRRKESQYALATLCVGGGMGVATVFQTMNAR